MCANQTPKKYLNSEEVYKKIKKQNKITCVRLVIAVSRDRRLFAFVNTIELAILHVVTCKKMFWFTNSSSLLPQVINLFFAHSCTTK